MAKKNTKKKQRKKKIESYKILTTLITLVVLVLSLGYIILGTNILEPKVDEITASYISFNNKNTTDMLRINNIKKMTDNKGKSLANTKKVSFEISGTKDTNYEIVVYPLVNDIDEKYINFSLTSETTKESNSFSMMPESSDGGIIIYQSKMEDSKEMTLRLWVSADYSEKITNNSFEVKIKPR